MRLKQYIAGVDEVGRGPLAGPVIAAAVILNSHQPIEGLVDSKCLSAKKREHLANEIQKKARAWSIGRAEAEEIDRINILQATFLAMQRAVLGLALSPDLVLVDGSYSPPFACASQAIVKGDQKIAAISAASIVAKVYRDAELCLLGLQYPDYGFEKHKGYGTAEHLRALEKWGPVSSIHRCSFAPVAKLRHRLKL